MAQTHESVYPASVDHTEFRITLARLGMRQTDFVRLLAYLGDSKADAVTINRWATGRRAVPSTVAVILRLWEMLPKGKRAQILKEASA